MDGRVRTGSLRCVVLLAALLPAGRADAEALAFGPKAYSRTSGTPNSVTDTFSICTTADPFRLRVENGPG